MKKLYVFLLFSSIGCTTSSLWSAEKKSAADYDKQSYFVFQRGKQAIDEAGLRGNERVLDVGCGTGRTTNYCAQQLTTGSVVGIDVSEDMIHFAQEAYIDTPNLEFHVCNANKLPFHNEFDVAYSFYCLQQVKEQKAALHNIAKSLKPGGRAILYVSHKGKLVRLFEECAAEIAKEHPEWQEHFDVRSYSPTNQWLQWCKEAGFSIRAQRIEDRVLKTFATLNDYKAFCMTLRHLPGLSEQEREEFVETWVRAAYRASGLQDDDPFDLLITELILELELAG